MTGNPGYTRNIDGVRYLDGLRHVESTFASEGCWVMHTPRLPALASTLGVIVPRRPGPFSRLDYQTGRYGDRGGRTWWKWRGREGRVDGGCNMCASEAGRSDLVRREPARGAVDS